MILQMVHFSDGTKVADLLVSALKTQWLTGHPSPGPVCSIASVVSCDHAVRQQQGLLL